jgi:hypothetical protein
LPRKKGVNVEEISREKNYILRRNSYRGAMPTNELQRVFEDIEAEKRKKLKRQKHLESIEKELQAGGAR